MDRLGDTLRRSYKDAYDAEPSRDLYTYVCQAGDERTLPISRSCETGFVNISDYAKLATNISDFVFVPGLRVAGRKTAVSRFLKIAFDGAADEIMKTAIDADSINPSIVPAYFPVFSINGPVFIFRYVVDLSTSIVNATTNRKPKRTVRRKNTTSGF